VSSSCITNIHLNLQKTMKSFTTLTFALVLGVALSCTDEPVNKETDFECLPAKFVARYCSANEGLSFVAFLKPTALATQVDVDNSDSTKYVAALLDLPKSVQRIDTTFYIKVRRDPERESKIVINTCPAIYTKVNILVCEGLSPQSCQPSQAKL
jgi:hypothetical protein